jgi:hypothetical protein
MTLSGAAAIDTVKMMLEFRNADRERLKKIHAYLHGQQPNPAVPKGSNDEVNRLARMSRVNMMKIVVTSVAQCLFVDGFRQRLQSTDAPMWKAWQANKMDKRQSGIHRSALAYGVSYATVLPGEPDAVIKGYSPRDMTTVYGESDDWPMWALQAQPSGDHWLYRLYDEQAIYFVEGNSEAVDEKDKFTFVETREHGLGVTPVIRFLNEEDLDEDHDGEIEPLMDLQDQIDLTTFSLLVAQHYAAFRQRYIIGWTAESEKALLKAGAARILTFDDDPDQVKVGEFEQTQLQGYLDSREETLKQAASLSQTPVHELIGSLVNLSAEALVAAEKGQQRKVNERQTSFGESWEMVFELVAQIDQTTADPASQVRWRDTESRALAATVDALGKMASQLDIPVQELWERIPGVTQQDIERWKGEMTDSGSSAGS